MTLPPRFSVVACALLLSTSIALAGCSAAESPGSAAASPAAGTSSVTSAATPSSAESAADSTPTASTQCIPSDVTDAGIPLVTGEVVCDLVRGELADGTLSIVIRVASIDQGFADATAALEQAGYTAGVMSPEASNFTNGTYSVLVSVTEQAPYGAVVTYVLSPA